MLCEHGAGGGAGESGGTGGGGVRRWRTLASHVVPCLRCPVVPAVSCRVLPSLALPAAPWNAQSRNATPSHVSHACGAMPCQAWSSRAVSRLPRHAMLRRVVSCHACRAMPGRAMPRRVVPCQACPVLQLSLPHRLLRAAFQVAAKACWTSGGSESSVSASCLASNWRPSCIALIWRSIPLR